MSILVVDDDPMICTLVSRVLQRAGYTVEVAHDGEQALKAIAVRRPHLMLVDRMMPGMTGEELISRLRAESFTIPCILMSASKPDCLADTLPFLAKPFAIDSLRDLVGEILGTHDAQGQFYAA